MIGFLRQVILGWHGSGAEPAAEAPLRLAQDDREIRRARRRRRRAREAARAGAAPEMAAEIDSFGQVVRLTAEAPHRIEGDLTHTLADTVFDVISDYPGDQIGIEVGDRAVIDVLRVRLRPGVTDVDRFINLGQGVRIGLIDVEAADQTDPHDKTQDGFLQIRRSADVRIDALRFRNIDRCVMVRGASRLWIGSLDCESYSKAMKLDGARDVYLGALTARVTSPRAGKHLGYSCLTVEQCARVHLPRIEVDDAAEHAVYISDSKDIRVGNVLARRSSGCGFKCKASASPCLRVSVDALTVIDAAFAAEPGEGARPGPGEDGLRVENTRGFHIGSLQVRREAMRYSCYSGLFLDGVTDFSLNGGFVEGTFGPMVRVEDDRGVANARILIAQLSGADIGAEGYRIRHAHGQALEGLVVLGGRLEGVAGDAVRIEGGARMAVKPNYIRLDTAGVRGALVRDAAGDPGTEVIVTDRADPIAPLPGPRR